MIINNITSAFAHNGIPVSNGSVEVYTDESTSGLANLVFSNGAPAPNPARLNANGGIGHPVQTELEKAYCVVRDARGAVLFGYHLTTSFMNVIFPNNDGEIEVNTSEGMDKVYSVARIEEIREGLRGEIGDEAARATEAEESLRNEIESESGRAQQAEEGLRGEIGGVRGLLDEDVETATRIASDPDSLQIETEYTNLMTGERRQENIDLPTVSRYSSGKMDSAMYEAFLRHGMDIMDIYSILSGQPRTAVVHGLPASPTQSQLTQEFANAIGGNPNPNDRLVNIDSGTEYIFSNGHQWHILGLGGAAGSLATPDNPGYAKHSALDGAVGYFTPGVGQLNGWSDLKAKVAANTANINAINSSQPWGNVASGRGNGDGSNKWQRVWRVAATNGVIDDNNYFFAVNGNYSITASFLVSMRKDFRTANNWGNLFFDIMASNARSIANRVRFTSDGTYVYLELAQTYGGTAVWANLGTLLDNTTTSASPYCWTVQGVAGNGTAGNYQTGTMLANRSEIPSLPLATSQGGTGSNYANKNALAYGIFQRSNSSLSYVYGENNSQAGYCNFNTFATQVVDNAAGKWEGPYTLSIVNVIPGNLTRYFINKALKLVFLTLDFTTQSVPANTTLNPSLPSAKTETLFMATANDANIKTMSISGTILKTRVDIPANQTVRGSVVYPCN